MGTTAGFASLAVLALLAIVLWLSLIDGQPGDPDLAYTARQLYRDVRRSFGLGARSFNTFVFSGLTLTVATAIGVPLAWIIERTEFPGKTLVLATMTIGLLVPGFATAIGWELAPSTHWYSQHWANK